MASKLKITDRDKGFKRVIKQVEDIGESFVTVGVHEGATPYPGGTPVGLVAAVNEFGSENGNIPERSFLRSTFDEQKRKMRQATLKLLAQVIDNRVSVQKALTKLGFKWATLIQNKIETMRSPPNAPSTIRQKPDIGDNPLINTRHLKNSITFEVTINKKNVPVEVPKK